MRMPWNKSKEIQLDLLDDAPTESPIQWVDGQVVASALDDPPYSRVTSHATPSDADPPSTSGGRPLLVSVTRLYEDPNNPRTEFPGAALEELAEDIHQRGVLQPLVVHPADGEGRHRIHFGAKRLRAAIRAGLHEVPVVVRDLPADRHAQVAENQKRHGLTPLELARFIRAQVDAGDSNATIARQLGMNLTTVAHHLALLDLPPGLDEALKSGRCTSPRTLHELSKLHADNPEQVQSLLDSGAEITRSAVSALRAEPDAGTASEAAPSSSNKLIAQANSACDRLQRALGRIQPSSNSYKVALPELIALRIRVEDITKRWLQGSDRQTPSQTGQ
jgi:ParB family transcriptional regulator, chromosome partitioning protein